jgi:hypothetical protein
VHRRRFLLTSLAAVLAVPLVVVLGIVAGGFVSTPLAGKAQTGRTYHAGEAQQARKVHRIGIITPELPTTPPGQGPFWDRMQELGWAYGQNVVIEHRVFGTDAARIPEITSELISLGTDVFVVPNGSTARGVQRVTSTIPIVTTSAGDLVAAGLAASVGRPGGNVTGLQVMQTEVGG